MPPTRPPDRPVTRAKEGRTKDRAAAEGERFARLETLVETIAERQAEQHQENRDYQEAQAKATQEHRHRSNNELQKMNGHLIRIEARVDQHGEGLVVAAEERGKLGARIGAVEDVVKTARGTWKVLAAIAGAIIGVTSLTVTGLKLIGLIK